MHTKEQILNMLTLTEDEKFIKDNLIFLVLGGSRAYGTNTYESDYDYRGIYVNPYNKILTGQIVEHKQQTGNKQVGVEDVVLYDVGKFLSLAGEVNPNIIELLFVDPCDIVYKHPVMDIILKNKHMFLSKKAKHSFSGYAFSQLKRIMGHKKWLDNPLEKPDREVLGLPKQPLLTKEKILALTSLSREELDQIVKDGIVEYLQKEVEYWNLKKDYDRYKEWIENRNKDRAEIEKKYSFDLKHAMHLIRLLRVGREILETHTCHTKRPDADFLMNIRNGKYTYEQLLEMAEKEEKELDELYKTSTLQHSIPRGLDKELLLDVIEKFHNL